MRGLMLLSGLEQLKAVENGDKPICCISPREIKDHHTDLEYIEVHMISRAWVNDRYYSKPFSDRIYYSEGHEDDAVQLKQLWERWCPMSDEDHRKIGTLLGYESDEIEEFIERIK